MVLPLLSGSAAPGRRCTTDQALEGDTKARAPASNELRTGRYALPETSAASAAALGVRQPQALTPDTNTLQAGTTSVKSGPGSRQTDVRLRAPRLRGKTADDETGTIPIVSQRRSLGGLKAAIAAVPQRLSRGVFRGHRWRRRRLYPGAWQGRPRSFRHQPRHPRRTRLRGRRYQNPLHHPVDFQTVRIRAGAGYAGRRKGRKRDRCRALGRPLQFDP